MWISVFALTAESQSRSKPKARGDKMDNEIKHNLDAILDLIESPICPAFRVISDYVVSIISHYDYGQSKEADEYINKYYESVSPPPPKEKI